MNPCKVLLYKVEKYVQDNTTNKIVVICARMLREIFTHDWSCSKKLEMILISAKCTCGCVHLGSNMTNVLFKEKNFPRLLVVDTSLASGYIPLIEGFETNKDSTTSRLFYLLERNKERMKLWVTTFLCIRKQYPQLDKNVVLLICSKKYLNIPDNTEPCELENLAVEKYERKERKRIRRAYELGALHNQMSKIDGSIKTLQDERKSLFDRWDHLRRKQNKKNKKTTTYDVFVKNMK